MVVNKVGCAGCEHLIKQMGDTTLVPPPAYKTQLPTLWIHRLKVGQVHSIYLDCPVILRPYRI